MKSFASQQVNLFLYKVPHKLVVSCNSAYGQYKASLEEKAKEAEKAVEKEMRELFQEELNRLIDKEKNLVIMYNSLDDDLVNLVGDAEKQPEERSVLVTKVNTLKGDRMSLEWRLMNCKRT